ncbi:MAG: hypothetical protein Ct9H90mP13_08730 [Pseudomonadota bacterium]|nr:MAG: hypothetical protein Ct9H90mP13_08730 [Pseudomonadota bacterium]
MFNGPDFIVHLTLSGPFYDLDEATIGGIEDLAVTNNKIEMTTNGYGIEDNIFQSFYVQIQKSSELMNLKGRLDDLLSITPKDFNPHISLFYGNIRQTLKQEVISKLEPLQKSSPWIEYQSLKLLMMLNLGKCFTHTH